MVTVGKGNNGKAAQRQLIRRLGIASGIFILISTALVGTLLFLGNEETAGGDDTQQIGLPKRRRATRGNHFRPRNAQRDNHVGMTDRREAYDAVLNGEKHLVELFFKGSNDIERIEGSFCRLEWHLHKKNPSQYPMFRDLVAASPDCEDRVTMNLLEVVTAAQERKDVNVLQLGGAVFHESRCGSTLTANLLASWRPQRHRVYSESTPPIQALHQLCGEDYEQCSIETAATLLQHVVYLMSRSNDPRETHVFFKMQSAGSKNIAVFQQAFPETPYLFVYRDPVQVMMSHLKYGFKSANCLRQSRRPGPHVVQVMQKYGQSQQPEDFCAAHLASITETVVESLTDYGIPVNYASMPDRLFEEVFVEFSLDEEITDAELARMTETAAVYSKGRGAKAGQEFEGDSEEKEEMASEKVRQAAARYLMPSYQLLEEAVQERTQQQRPL